MCKHPLIGVFDGGVGGITVLKELLKVCPDAEYIYCGDSANTPFSTKPKEEFVCYICDILDFLQKKQVDVAAVACNAMSSLLPEYQDRYSFPIVDVISPVCGALGKREYRELVVLSTTITEQIGIYPQLLSKANSEIKSHSLSTAKLPMLLNRGSKLTDELKQEVHRCLDKIESIAGENAVVVMACTHFPLVKGYMEQVKPKMNFIDPAVWQAQKVQELLGGRKCPPKLTLYTNGNPQIYMEFLDCCDIKIPYEIYQTSFQ